MRSSSHVVAELAGGITRLTRLRSEAPVLLKPTPQGLYLIGGAAGPLGGDDARLRVEVGPGARLDVHSTAATLALPGRSGGPSRLRIEAAVAEGAELRWLTEPTILAKGCNHRIRTRLDTDETALVIWREELILGRHGERPGSASSRMDCCVGGKPVYRNEQIVGDESPGWDGPAVFGDAKAAGNLLVVDPEMATKPITPAILGDTAAIMPLAGPAGLATALAGNSIMLRDYLNDGLRHLTSERRTQLSA